MRVLLVGRHEHGGAQARVTALDVALVEAEDAKAAPVMLPAGSLLQARASLLGTASGDVPTAASKKIA